MEEKISNMPKPFQWLKTEFTNTINTMQKTPKVTKKQIASSLRFLDCPRIFFVQYCTVIERVFVGALIFIA